jgi:hypothetical protein
MRVDVAKLYEAFRRAAWRWGVSPDLLKHEIVEDGAHVISLRLEKDGVVWEEPTVVDMTIGLSSTRPPPGRKTTG